MVKNCLFLLNPSSEHLVCDSFERHMGTLLPKKVPKQKTCLIPSKRVISDYYSDCMPVGCGGVLNLPVSDFFCQRRAGFPLLFHSTLLHMI